MDPKNLQSSHEELEPDQGKSVAHKNRFQIGRDLFFACKDYVLLLKFSMMFRSQPHAVTVGFTVPSVVIYAFIQHYAPRKLEENIYKRHLLLPEEHYLASCCGCYDPRRSSKDLSKVLANLNLNVHLERALLLVNCQFSQYNCLLSPFEHIPPVTQIVLHEVRVCLCRYKANLNSKTFQY
ncbi:hypothetical protein F5050DRAFT_1817287 [Lentinula boryana]|uniref:Uncharacterized protein n=1 Tax=Lentinula boryana TaxID=40481 RepID=A0ABQ8PWB2_9AGAR|nr:hypothetical protein F5050DRAFT_1817287 [Lentinula boryana]